MPDFSKLLDFEGGPYELSPLDCIIIGGVVLPLAEPPEVSRTLELDKKKGAGKDGAALVGRGYVKDTVKIRLRLFKDIRRKDPETGDFIDWLSIYYNQVHDKVMPKEPAQRNAISVYYPFLSAEGISSLAFTKRHSPRHEGRGIYTVELEGEDPANFKKHKGGETATPKQDKELKSRALGNAGTDSKSKKPSDAQKGKP